jgi:hypothetical protein
MSSIACIFGVVLATATTHAQAVYQPLAAGSTYTVGGTPRGVAVVDLNRDGKPDSVTANGTANTIGVVLSNNTGYAVTTYGTGTGTTPVAIGVLPDFARSGSPAVAVVEQGRSRVAIYTDSAAGVLTLDTTYGTGATPTGIAVGDFNNDGIPDIAVSYATGVTVLLGSENGAFNPGGAVSAGTKLSAITVGYFHGVKNADLAVTDQTGNRMYILTGSGTGSFTAGGAITVGTTPESIGVADFNHDGKVDIAVGNYASNNVSVFLGNGNGAFGAQAKYAAGSNVQSLVIADVNNDGNADIVVADALVTTGGVTTGGTFGVLLGTGTGLFQTVLTPAVASSPYGLAVGDFNRDGKPDLAVTQNAVGTVSLYLNNTLINTLPGGRNFLAATQSGAGNMADAIATGDFNGDGIPDVAVAYLEDGTVGVMFGNGSGGFGAQTLYPVGKHPYSIAVGDLNHDGSPDIVVANETDGTVTVLLNTGTGAFTTKGTYTVGRLPTGVAIGDLNGDGIPDLAVTNYGANDVSILIGAGDGSFTPGSTPTLAGQTNPYNVVIADFNGDGNQDVAFTNFQSGSAEVYLGNGNGSFQSPTILTIPSLAGGGGSAPVGSIGPSSIAVGDFNRDGNLDFAVGTAGGNTVAIFLGNGDGGFTSSAIQTLNFPISIAVGDVNNDGIPDIVNVNPNFNSVTVLEGNGDGTFTARWQFPTSTSTAPSTPGAQPWAIALADFNHDGKLDIVTANTIARINLAIPAYQPAAGAVLSPPSPLSTSVLLNSSGTNNVITVTPSGTLAYNQAVTIGVQVTPALGGAAATGSVILEDTTGKSVSNAPIPLTGGAGSIKLQNLGSGTHIIGSLYSGNVNYQPNTTVAGSQPIVIRGTQVALTLNPSTISFMGTFTATITVTGTAAGGRPTGSLNLYIYTPSGFEAATTGQPFPLTAADCTGDVCTYSVSISDPNGVLTPGTYLFYAQYNPNNANYQTGTSPNELLTVTQVTPTMTLNCVSIPFLGFGGCFAQVTASGNVVETGTVDFSLNGGTASPETIGDQVLFGYGAFYTYTPPSGNYTVLATFPAGQDGGGLAGATALYCSGPCPATNAAFRGAIQTDKLNPDVRDQTARSLMKDFGPMTPGKLDKRMFADPRFLKLLGVTPQNNSSKEHTNKGNKHSCIVIPGHGGSGSGGNGGGGGVVITPGGGNGGTTGGNGGGGVVITPGGGNSGTTGGNGGGGVVITAGIRK